MMGLQILDSCGGMESVVAVVKHLYNILRILVPIGLLIMGAWDLGKAVLASDDKEIKAATTKLIKRAIAALAVFFSYTIVNVVMGLVDDAEGSDEGTTSWASCWNSV